MADPTLPFSSAPAKRCKLCRKIKPLTEFHYRRDEERHRAECKDCYRANANARRDPIDNRRRVKAWQQANPDKRRVLTRRTYERARTDLRRAIALNLRNTRAYCKRKGIPYSITADDVVALYAIQDGRCAILGRALIWGGKAVERDTMSIDRVEPSKGYVPGNIRLVTYQANMSRGPYSDDEFYAMCAEAIAHRAATTT